MFTDIRMTTALVVLALAFVCLLAFFIVETRPKKTMSMLDLAEFKDLPGELRAIIKSMMPNGTTLKKHWSHMSPQQKQMVIQQLTNQMPRAPQPDTRPPAPSVLVKHEPVDEPSSTESGLKPGFLLSDSVDKGQKKNPKNKKKDKVVTFSDVGTTEDEEPVSTDITDL
jgi:hypothetical protein